MSNIIKTTSYDNTEIITAILKLHVPNGRIDCDPTYSKGNFYRNTGIEPPKLKYDISPQTEDCTECDCRNLPLEGGSLNCIMFDPPFLSTKGPSLKKRKKETNITTSRFSCYPTEAELYKFYERALEEFYRVLSENGVLIFKCQDMVSSGVQYMSHVYIHNMAVEMGFYPKDLFILNSRNRLISGKHKNQKHARKFHCYYWVFEKGNRKIDRIKQQK